MTDLKSNPSNWNPEFSASLLYSSSWDTRDGSHLFHLLTKTDLSPLHLGVPRSPVLSWSLLFPHPKRPAEGGKALRRPRSLSRLPAAASLVWHHGCHWGKLALQGLAVLVCGCHEVVCSSRLFSVPERVTALPSERQGWVTCVLPHLILAKSF